MTLPYVKGWGNTSAKLVIVGESPSFGEGSAFTSNKNWREFDDVLKMSDINRNDVWFTYACKHYVPPNKRGGRKIPFLQRAKDAGVNMDEQVHNLSIEINSLSPNCVLALGNIALWATTGKSGITNYRGSILPGIGGKVVGSYDPRGLNIFEPAEFVGYWNKQVILFDTIRAKKQSAFNGINRPVRNLYIARNSDMILNFISRFSKATRPACDIEARGKCIPFCVGFSFNPNEGMCIPLWNKGESASILNVSDSEMAQMWILIQRILDENEIVGQNFKYDEDKLRRLGFNIRRLVSDTMMKLFACYPEFPKGLGFMTSILTEEPYYKDEGMYEGSAEDLMIGCARDSCVTKEIDLALDTEVDTIGTRKFFENFLMELHPMYLEVEAEGFNIDKEVRESLFKKYVGMSEDMQYRLWKILGYNININSPKQVSLMLYDNFGVTNRGQGTGEEEITAILNTGKLKPDQVAACDLVLKKRRVDKTLNHYLAAMPDYDGKMKTTYFLCLETGRTSTSQQSPPIRPEVEVRDEYNRKKSRVMGIAFQTITKHGDIGNDVRKQYVPEPGYVFLGVDSAQAEARVVFLLANDEDALYKIDHHDYHALTASWFFGGTEADYSKKALGYEHPIRFVGKTLRHAGHLGASPKRAMVNTDARKFGIDIKITQGFAQDALAKFHRNQPSIQKVFQEGIREALRKNNRWLIAGLPYGIDSICGGKRQFLERWDEELFRQSFSYIPQRSVSDNTKSAALRLRKREPKLARLILEAHDGLLYTVPESEVDYFAPIVKEEMERPISFEACSLPRRELIIPAEVEVGYNYMEFKKYKFKATEAEGLYDKFAHLLDKKISVNG
jgi:DNA polymerase I-like protein with 3'-5' exonuclease and polymerase domains/uracil-DNA glycosylase